MRQRNKQAPQSAEEAVRDIWRATRRHFSAEEKIRIVLEGLRGEDSIALVEANLGVAILSSWTPLPPDPVAVDVEGFDLCASVSLHAVAGRMRSAATLALINAVRCDRVCEVETDARQSKLESPEHPAG